MSAMNSREAALLAEATAKAKGARNADMQLVWRDGKLVDVRVTEIFDREKVKATQD